MWILCVSLSLSLLYLGLLYVERERKRRGERVSTGKSVHSLLFLFGYRGVEEDPNTATCHNAVWMRPRSAVHVDSVGAVSHDHNCASALASSFFFFLALNFH